MGVAFGFWMGRGVYLCRKEGINIQWGKFLGDFWRGVGVRKYENLATDCCYFFEQKNKRTYILCVVEGDGDK